MSTVLAIGLGVLRFVGALVLGTFLLLSLALLALLNSGAGLVNHLLPWGYLVIFVFALRFAVAGTPTRFDRAAGVVAAGLAATGLVIVAIVASIALAIMAVLWFLGMLAQAGSGTVGENPAAEILAPYALLANVAALGASVGALALVYFGLRAWSPSVSTRSINIAMLIVVAIAIVAVKSF